MEMTKEDIKKVVDYCFKNVPETTNGDKLYYCNEQGKLTLIDNTEDLCEFVKNVLGGTVELNKFLSEWKN